MTALPATLNVGYSTRTKLAVTGIAALGWLLMLTLSGDDLASVSVVPYTAALLASVFLLSTVRSGFVIDSGALHHTTWRGTKSYAANDFLAANAVTDKNGKSGVVLRFRTGIVMLTASRGCSDPNAIARYIASEWTAEDPAYAEPLGPVNEDLVLQYETIHIALLAVVTVVLAALAVVGPMFWVAAIGAVVAGHALYRITTQSRVEATREGVTVHRAFQAPLTIRWDRVQSVRFWYSLAHGGMKISDGTNTIRVYRWIQDYPRLNRMAQDLAPGAAFSTDLTLPCTIELNQRRYAAWVTLAIAAGVSLWMASQDAWALAFILTGVPLAAHLYNCAANSCRIEIGRDTLRVIERRSFADSTRSYRREDLIDARLGRQLSVGGLWLRFGKERVEIGNLDSSRAPEQILRVLSQEWNSEATPDSVKTSVLTSAA